MKKLFTNTAIVLIATLVGLLLCEILSRLFLNPADYLSASMEKHEILGRAITPKSAGFDDWGFRNKAVPEQVDIVAIGDSHTYGNTAKMEESWPHVLGNLTGKSVYNMGMGGYGPNQYNYLLKSKAIHLRPRIILCGVYMGDDFENAFTITYGLDYWIYLRQGQYSGSDPDIWKAQDDGRWFRNIRAWLSQNSLLYQLVVHGPILGNIKGGFQIQRAADRRDEYTTTLIAEDKNIREAFRPTGIRDRLDQNNEAIREGMRITLLLLKDMDDVCRQNGCKFIVVIIPTKETVFSKYINEFQTIHLGDVIQDLVLNEKMARLKLIENLGKYNIAYIDTAPALSNSIDKQLYANSDRDMHPSRNGYRVIAETVAAHLRSMDSSK